MVIIAILTNINLLKNPDDSKAEVETNSIGNCLIKTSIDIIKIIALRNYFIASLKGEGILVNYSFRFTKSSKS